MWTFIVVFVLLIRGAHSFGEALHLICGENQVVSQIESSLNVSHQDRHWHIECKDLDTDDCSWTGFHSLRGQDLNLKCPANQVVAGIFSDFMGAQGGRRWNIYCCSVPEMITSDCLETPMINYWNDDFTWHVPEGSALTGIHAKNDEDNEGDQRWSFTYCKGTTGDSETINSKILAVNKPIEDRFTQGDVVIKKSRNAMTCNSCKWLKSKSLVEVPYTLSTQFSSSTKSKILEAMTGFHLSTCIRFVPRTHQLNYVQIVKDSGCWSYVGRTGGSQQLSIGQGCAYKGIIQHELIHSVGFWHEQSRSDRDLFVRINYENIIDGYSRNFDKFTTNNLNVPYDYSSVMHYGAKDFSKNGEDTITPLTPSVQIGQRFGMSESDILKINKFYGCRKYLHKNGNWDNRWHRHLNRECPSGQVVSKIASFYSSKKKDRLWGISCRAFQLSKQCRWSRFVNKFRGNINFKCPDNKVIAGVISRYSKISRDRRWKFQCCSFSDFTTFNCQTTPEVNNWKEYIHWSVPSSNFLTGVKSSYSVSVQDRRWSFSYCQRSAE